MDQPQRLCLTSRVCAVGLCSGGLEQLFGKIKRHELLLSPVTDGDDGRVTLRAIIRYMKERKLKDRPELFTQDSTVSAQRSTAGRTAVHCSAHHELLLILLISSLSPSLCRRCRRPGILVLVNDCDWELMDGLNCVVRDGDCVTFISTLHGG